MSGGVTRFGAYLDSVVDRYTDMLLMFGLLFYVLAYFEQAQRPVWARDLVSRHRGDRRHFIRPRPRRERDSRL